MGRPSTSLGYPLYYPCDTLTFCPFGGFTALSWVGSPFRGLLRPGAASLFRGFRRSFAGFIALSGASSPFWGLFRHFGTFITLSGAASPFWGQHRPFGGSTGYNVTSGNLCHFLSGVPMKGSITSSPPPFLG